MTNFIFGSLIGAVATTVILSLGGDTRERMVEGYANMCLASRWFVVRCKSAFLIQLDGYNEYI